MSKKLISPILVIALAQFSGSALAARKSKGPKPKDEVYAATETSAADLPIVTSDNEAPEETLADLATDDDARVSNTAAPAKQQAGTVAKDEAETPSPAATPAPAPAPAAEPASAPDPALDARVNKVEAEMNHIRAEARAEESGEPAPVQQAFDNVPAEQKDAIEQRLQIVGDLISKYGRAYDYRTHTLSELKKIQADLDAQAKAAANKS